MLRWEGKLDEIYLHAGGALLYRLLLDWYVNFYLHFDWSQFEWHPKEFTQLVTPEFPDYYIKDWKVYEKARYGISLYDASYYDPLSPSPIPTKDLERIAWQLRYAFTERDASAWRRAGKTLEKELEWFKETLKAKGYPDYYADAIRYAVSEVEGKVINAAYFGFAVFGLSRFLKPRGSSAEHLTRDPVDLTSERIVETLFPTESRFGFARFGYSRLIGPAVEAKPELVRHLARAVDDFHKRIGMVPIGSQKLLYQRVFMLPRAERYHWRGGEHQIALQSIINQVKELCDRHGIIANIRMGYVSFAQQLAYLTYQPHRYYKRWKRHITPDELVDRFVRMGFDRVVLEEIRRMLVV